MVASPGSTLSTTGMSSSQPTHHRRPDESDRDGTEARERVQE